MSLRLGWTWLPDDGQLFRNRIKEGLPTTRSECGEREAERHEHTLCSGFQCLTLCFLLTRGAKRGEFGDAENDRVGGEEKSAVAAAGCFLNSRHERS